MTKKLSEHKLSIIEKSFNRIKEGFSIMKDVDELTVIMDDEYPKIYGPLFLVVYADGWHYIYFEIDSEPKYVAETMRLMGLFLPPQDIIVGDSFFYNPDTNKMVFGDKAIGIKQEYIQKSKGKVQCPVCENFFIKKLINKDGICVICEKHVINKVTFH